MEVIIITIIKALGLLGEQGVHYVLDLIETKIVDTSTEIDNEIFYTVLDAIKSYEPKNLVE